MRKEYVISMSIKDKNACQEILKKTNEKLVELYKAAPAGEEKEEFVKLARQIRMVRENLFE